MCFSLVEVLLEVMYVGALLNAQSKDQSNSTNADIFSPSISDTFDYRLEILQKDPDRDFLLSGIKEGFHIIDKGATLESSETKKYL